MKPPKTLSKKAKDTWTDIERLSAEKLNTADYAIIEQFCREIDLYDKAVKEIEDEGFVNKHNQVAPAVTVRNQAAGNMRQLYKQIRPMLTDAKELKPKLRSVKNF